VLRIDGIDAEEAEVGLDLFYFGNGFNRPLLF